jgi:hypothetical protein
MTDALDRMFNVLARVVRENRPELARTPFTVADLHQQLLPYRHFRRELGLETNQEYELILMELLSGARGYLDVDERLRDELGKELHASTPDPSRVGEFAEAQVSLNPAAFAKAATWKADGGQPRRSGAAAVVVEGAKCRYCSVELPKGRAVNFCPSCGQNLQVQNCPACGAEMEDGWKHCVACGKSVS